MFNEMRKMETTARKFTSD